MYEIDFAQLLDDPRATLGAQALDGAAAKEDFRNDPEFETIESEFRKMESDGPGAVDWKMINVKAVDVLANRSKDLILASWLAYGLYREEGYRGLAIGVSILDGMVSEHWDTLFPPLKRERGRAGSFDWLAEKLATVVEAEAPGETQRVYALAAHDALLGLDDKLTGKLTRFPVALGPLIRALRPYAREARAALENATAPKSSGDGRADATQVPVSAGAQAMPSNAAPVEQSKSVAQPEPAASVLVAPEVPDIPSDQGADKAFQALFGAAGRVASSVRQQVPNDYRGYLCARLALWGAIADPPPDQAGRTFLPPPQRQKRDEIAALQSAGNNPALVVSAEGAFVSSPFWLDAQHLVVKAMEALGPSYDRARITVIGQLQAFLKRLPAVTGLSFNDGTPFAGAEATNWIMAEVMSGGSDGAVSAGDALDMVRAEAEKAGQAGKVLDGLGAINSFAEACFGERDRFLAQLAIGEYCLRFELLQPLFALVARLKLVIEARSLDKWEPDLAVALASLSWRVHAHKNAGRYREENESRAERLRVMATLAEFDIVAAARLSSGQSAQ